MKIKVKKQNSDGIVKLESSGDIKEFIFKQDLLNSENSPLLICFRGKNSSGIIELTEEDLNKLINQINNRKQLLNQSKVLKFEK